MRAFNGVYTFNDVNIIGRPAYKTNLKFSSSSIDAGIANILASSNQNSSLKNGDLEIPINFRQCIPGEVTQNSKCERCNKGYFSFNPFNNTC